MSIEKLPRVHGHGKDDKRMHYLPETTHNTPLASNAYPINAIASMRECAGGLLRTFGLFQGRKCYSP